MLSAKTLRLIFASALLVATALLTSVIYKNEHKRQQIKEDLIELSKIKYGLFSVDEWKHLLAGIITKKIGEFNFEGENRAELHVKIEGLLREAVRQLRSDYEKSQSQNMLGFLQSTVLSFTGVFDQIENRIPWFTDQVIDFMNNPENRERIRGYIIMKLNEYADNTFAKMDYTEHDRILKKYDLPDRATALSDLNGRIATLDQQRRPYFVALLAVSCVAVTYVLMLRSFSRREYLLLILATFASLMAGLLLPMIEIDARISTMRFTLLGEAVVFHDQVLYYKSKSILQVVGLMLTQHRLDVLFVGLLVLLFSVLFPVCKLLSSIGYLYSDRLRTNRFINFMIFRTGKWSMADVMVIAIFMAYIGFSGIISEQLRQIENITQSIDILTTNRSSLMTGFFAFTSFAIVSLLISHKLHYDVKTVE
jgi:hypothetical protein